MKHKLTITLLLLLCAVSGFAQKPQQREGSKIRLAVKTNLLAELNFGLELGDARYSIAAHGYIPRWHNELDPTKCFDATLFDAEFRYWFHSRRKRVFSGHFLGLYGLVGMADVAAHGKGNQADLKGFGLSYGYVLPMGRHFRMEFSLGVGYVEAEFSHYRIVQSWMAPLVTSTGTTRWIGPNKAELSFICVLGK